MLHNILQRLRHQCQSLLAFVVVGIVGHDSRAGPGSKLVVSNFPMAVALGLVDNRRRKLAEGCRKDQERAALPVGGTVAVVHIQSVEMRKFDQQEADSFVVKNHTLEVARLVVVRLDWRIQRPEAVVEAEGKHSDKLLPDTPFLRDQ